MHTGNNRRDATYLTALPFNALSSPGQVLLIAGINYAQAGVAKQGLGLQRFFCCQGQRWSVPFSHSSLWSVSCDGVPWLQGGAGMCVQSWQ